MKIPKGSTKFFDKAARWLVDIYSVWAVRYVVSPIVLALPPAVITALYGNQPAKLWLTEHWPTLSNFMTANVLYFIAFAAIYPTIILNLAKAIAQKANSNGLSVDGLLALLTSLDSIVGCKDARFAKHAAESARLSREEAFCKITDPHIQIYEIIREICNLFNATQTDKRKSLIRVTLAEIENGKIATIPVYFPTDEPVRASLEKLNSPNSAIMTALKTKRTVIIEDIKKELERPIKSKRKFVDSGNEADNTGSIICYPVFHNSSKSIPYVVSIHSEAPGYFKNDFKDLYEHSLQRFALRLSLEISLLNIKEKLCG